MDVEKRAISKMPIAVVAGDSKSENAHGGLAKQSLNVWSQTCVTSLPYPLLHHLNTYFLATAPVIFVIT